MLLMNIPREAKDFFEMTPGDRSRFQLFKSMMSIVAKIIVLLTAHKEGFFSSKVLQYISKLMLLTSLGEKSNLKSKAVRTVGFVSTMTNKVKERFKL